MKVTYLNHSGFSVETETKVLLFDYYTEGARKAYFDPKAYAEKDIFCAGQTERFAKKLDEKDVYYESFCSKSPFVNHCFSLEWKSKQAQRANILQSLFLRKIKEGMIDKKQSESIYLIREEI